MPIENGAYISPTWKNDEPPALSSSECTAISQTAEQAQDQIGDIIFTSRRKSDLGADWLPCNGAGFDEATYSELASMISITVNLNWVSGSIPSLPAGGWSAVTYGGGKFVAVSNVNAAAYSVDGINWTLTVLPYSRHWYSVAYGNGIYVAVSGNYSAYSADGITWSAAELPSIAADYVSVAFGNGKFVAVTSGKRVAYSADGINWTLASFSVDTEWSAIAFGDGTFVAVTANHRWSSHSSDGSNWTNAELPSSDHWAAIAYGGGMFVTVAGRSTKAAYSTDGGLSWTATTLPQTANWSSVVYTNRMFVAIASDSADAAYSIDGINWASSTLPASATWISSAYGNNRAVAIAGLSGLDIAACSQNAGAYKMIPNIQKTYGKAYIRAQNGGSYTAPDFSSAKLSSANLNGISDTLKEWQKKKGDIVITGRNEQWPNYQRLAAKEHEMNIQQKSAPTVYNPRIWINLRPPAIGQKNIQTMTDTAQDCQKRVGDILFSIRSSVTGFLACDGSAINPQTYPILASIFGTNLPTITQSGVTVYVKAG